MKKKNIVSAVVIIIVICAVLVAYALPNFEGGLNTTINTGVNSGGSDSGVATTTTAPGGTASSSAAAGAQVQDQSQNCGGCLGINDNGKTIAVSPTSRITIELPESSYGEKTLSVSPAGSLGETSGATAAAGEWVRTFEAVSAGTTTISIPSKIQGTPDYNLTLRILGSADSWENGMTIVTESNNGGTVHFNKNERFLIQFGDSLSWSLSFAPDGIITRVPNSTSADGFQGVYEASATGTAVLRAEGRPICKAGEACPQFIAVSAVNFVVN